MCFWQGVGKNKLLNSWKERNIAKDKRLLKAFLAVPRELFINSPDVEDAYEDKPRPIGEGQTISQPTTVMLMTEALEVKPGQKILEIGAGSGWQAGILGKMAGRKGKVVSAEIIPSLAKTASENLKKAKIKNVRVVLRDGSKGFSEEAPFDRILVTAACPEIPQPLIGQLKVGGILVAPVGKLGAVQTMVKLRKKKHGVEREELGEYLFVPMRGEWGFA
ncbi:protein-L-isoaspartate(D-aspartate) O-methyltransferase [Candidatus Woesearchaeota archaeon]|nr:protein-L-isoaspartate(D-aspartate) O-methyltransferase [Candidatus Woesearchaeota archaeon]